MIVLGPVVALLAVVAGVLFGWQWVLGPLLGLGVWMAASATLRSLVGPGGRPGGDEHEDTGGAGGGLGLEGPPGDGRARTLYRCEACGTELLVLVAGTDAPPRHCGRSMQEHSEVLN